MKREKNLETCLVISTGLVVLWLVYGWEWLPVLAVTIGVIGLFFNSLAERITWVWYKIAELLGLFIPRILLSLIFFVLLVPLAFLYRIFNRDSLQLRKKSGGTYWVERKHRYKREDLEQIW